MASSDARQDAYVFVSSGSEPAIDALNDLWRQGAVRYVARLLSGAYGALAFLEAPAGDEGLEVLRDRIAAVRDRVNPGASVGLALTIGPRAPSRWSEKQPVGAYVRIRAQSGLAGTVFDSVNGLPAGVYSGSALVIGDWDVLLELGAGSFEAMKKVLLEEVNPIPGVLWTDTAIVMNERFEPTAPERTDR